MNEVTLYFVLNTKTEQVVAMPYLKLDNAEWYVDMYTSKMEPLKIMKTTLKLEDL